MRRVYEEFFHAGEVVEIRAIDVDGIGPWKGRARGTVSGYFDNAETFAKAAKALDDAQAKGVYFTINPCNPALLARANNRLIANPKLTTQDNDVVCLRWLPIDLDPMRPSGISATDAEVKAAIDLGQEITAWLEGEIGLAKGVRAFSGNGLHVLYRLPDLPNDAEHRDLVKRAIGVIATKFTSDKVDVDVKTINPARIWKLYGTTGRKGDSTETRPHRRSYIYEGQALGLEDNSKN
jgi:hypothetical protein